MDLKHWKLTRNEGTQCLEHNGYFISITKLIERPVFWTGHVAGKIWAAEPVVQERYWAVFGGDPKMPAH